MNCLLCVILLCSLRGDKQKPCIDVAHRIFIQEGSLTNEQRCSVLEKVCLPLLRASQTSTLIEFFSDHIREILAALEAKEVKVLSSFHFLNICLFQFFFYVMESMT